MTKPESLTVRINPDNRRVNIKDPAYQENWEREFKRTRAEYEEELKRAQAEGELEVSPDPNDPRANTLERAIHLQAHTAAELAMKDWAVLGGIGLGRVTEIYDHGKTVRYVDDPAIPLYGHEIEQEAKAA